MLGRMNDIPSRQQPLRGSRPGLRPGLRPSAGRATPPPASSDGRKVFTVARLLQEVQQQLEGGFGTLWLQGEISNLSRPGSGHLYFSLKDSRAQIRCAMFKGRNQHLDFEPRAGDEVLVRGVLGLYAARGDFQLIVEHMEPAGAGQLQAAFERTKRELNEAGWFDSASKQDLPSVPQTIGIVTSATGAALRDVLQVLARRYPQGRVILYPSMTQGAQAAPLIAQAIGHAARRAEVDVLLIVRGGGSLEDLWAFNERSVAAAIRDCSIPVVSGVGHEVDITISDLVADLRAPTPSAAAELATPDGHALGTTANRLDGALVHAMQRHLREAQRTFASLDQRLAARRPERLLEARAQRIDELNQRLTRTQLERQRQASASLSNLQVRLDARQPGKLLADARQNHSNLDRRLENAMQQRLSACTARWQPASRALQAVGPMAVLARGYAVLRSDTGVVTRVTDVTPGTALTATLADGDVVTRVESVSKSEQKPSE